MCADKSDLYSNTNYLTHATVYKNEATWSLAADIEMWENIFNTS